jgi:ankyrin repeat protein
MEKARTKSSLVHVSVSSGMEGLLHWALVLSETDINMQDWCYESIPMSIAIEWGSDILLEILLGIANADVNLKTESSKTLLHIAASLEHLEAIKVLLMNGAEVDLRNDKGNTPLYNATWEDHVEVVGLPLEKGAEVDLRSNDGDTPL